VDALVECDLHQRLNVLVLAGAVRLQGGADRLGLLDHAEEHPRLGDLAFAQVEVADVAGRLADGLLVGGVRRGGEVLRGPGGDGGNAQLVPLLQQQGVEQARVVLLLAQPGAQPVDGGAGALGA
jgi:hypothetical protein